VAGGLVLRRAEVGFLVQLTSLTAEIGSTPDGHSHPDQVISAAGLRVEGNVECRQLVTLGQISFAEATLAGRLLFHGGGRLVHPGRIALYAANLRTTGSVEFGEPHADTTDQLTIVGEVRLDQAHIGEIWWKSVLVTDGGSTQRAAGSVEEIRPLITLHEAVVARRVLMNDVEIEATPGQTVMVDLSEMQAGTVELPPGDSAVDLRDATVRTLVLDPADTTTVMLSGLTFDDLGGADVDAALAWLRRDLTGYQHQVYEQLAAHYHRSGDDAAARTVQLARLRHRRDLMGASSFGQLLMNAWGYLQDITVGYGYRPGLAAVWFVGLLAFGTAYFWGQTIDPVEQNVHPTFNSFGYTLDLLIPLLSLGQDSAWDPTGPDLWVSYSLVFAGTILVTTVGAAVTRVLNRR
jgi:hypothetical protein